MTAGWVIALVAGGVALLALGYAAGERAVQRRLSTLSTRVRLMADMVDSLVAIIGRINLGLEGVSRDLRALRPHPGDGPSEPPRSEPLSPSPMPAPAGAPPADRGPQ